MVTAGESKKTTELWNKPRNKLHNANVETCEFKFVVLDILLSCHAQFLTSLSLLWKILANFNFVFSEIDAPKNLKAVDVKSDSAALTWTPPQAQIDGYVLSYRPEDGSMQVSGLLIFIYLTSSVLSSILLEPECKQ